MAEEEVGRRINRGRRIMKVILIILAEEEVGRRIILIQMSAVPSVEVNH